MKRRTFIKKSLLGITGLGLASGYYAWQVEPFWLEFVELDMPIKNLPEELIGQKLLHISDLHICDLVDYEFISESLEKAKAYNPAFVVYTGDFIGDTHNPIRFDKLEEIMQSAVKGSLGTLAVLGNHDYGYQWALTQAANRVTAILQKSGVQMLRNTSTKIAGIRFFGFDDYWGPYFKPEQTMKKLDVNEANIALCHNPDVCDLPEIWKDYDSWILSGHTHGGQFKPPFLPPPILPVENKRYSAGLIPLSNGRSLYINRALGYLVQLRLNVRPEITVFTLQRA